MASILNCHLIKIDGQRRTISIDNRRSYSITLSQALNVHDEKSKMILIMGDPGMGKSTLAINICKCWADGSLLQTYDAVILLPLRDPEIQKAKTVGDLLLTPDEELTENVSKEIMKNFGDKICFILEGYDELSQDLRKFSVFTKLKEKLTKCTLVYTSRPEACEVLESVASRIVKIEGFEEQSVQEYNSNAFEGVKVGRDLTAQLKVQLQQNSVLRGILLVPINVAIVCLIYFHFSMLPETLTQLYTLLCLRLVLRHITTRTANVAQVEELHSLNELPIDISKQFSQLCFIAYRGMENNQIVYSSRELKSINVNISSDLGLLVTVPGTSVYGIEKSYNFLHKTLQEFCAAQYTSKLSLNNQMMYINTYWKEKKFAMVW